MSHKVDREKTNCLKCGCELLVLPSRLRSGRGKYCSKTCGNSVTSTRHGHSGKRWQSPTYTSWINMRKRCIDPASPKYYQYGGAGITVDPRWDAFINFLADMGERPEGKTLDRIDGTKGYSKENCRWSTITEQQQNMKSNVRVTYQGETHCISEWARRTGIHSTVLSYRIRKGWSIDEVFTVPVKYGNRVSKKAPSPLPVS